MSDDESPSGTNQPLASLSRQKPDDTIRILLATDNHIGYLERDSVRGQDSINTFEEILQLAVKNKVDFILLAGDLFHENKPSRESLYRTCALIRKYTMSDDPIAIELLSDPMDGKAPGFESVFPAINYEDPNYNVGTPIFSIHGNHDDPQGAGQDGALCALDILSVAGLINYFGKSDLSSDDYAPIDDAAGASNGITVKPILLRKGDTKLGLYGMGNVKDQRMHKELSMNKVKMYKPKHADDYFNILLVHQNRVKRGALDAVPEGMFDDSINLVVWGHEHDCRIIPEPVAGCEYRITQPGSSVATSLSEGEAIAKHVALIEVLGKEYTLKPIPLKTVRPFVMGELDLQNELVERRIDPTDTVEVMKVIRAEVEALIQKAQEEKQDVLERAEYHDDEEAPPDMLPLVRLKVDTSGVANMGNPNRIGQEFTGRIANKDPVVYIQAKKRAARAVKMDQPELSVDDPDLSISEKLSRVRVATLVKEYLTAQELQILEEEGMSEAIQQFVEKDDTHSINQFVKKYLKRAVQTAEETGNDQENEEDDVEDQVARVKEKLGEDQRAKAEAKASKKTEASKSKGKGKAVDSDDDAASVDSLAMDDDLEDMRMSVDEDDSDEAPKKQKAPAKKAPATKKTSAKKATVTKKAPAKGKGKGKALFNNSDDDDDDDDDGLQLDDDEEEDEPPPPPKRKSRVDVLSSKPKAPAKKKAAAEPANSTRGSTRASASRAKSKMADTIELSD